MPYEVIVAGHLCLDLLPDMGMVPLDKLASPGKLFEIGGLTLATGGAVSNTGLALHRLGVNVGLMTGVGDDFIGRSILYVIEQRDQHLTDLIKIRAGQPGSYTIALSPGGQDRIFLHCTGTNADFSRADIDFGLVAQAKIFHFGYPPILPLMYANDGAELVSIYQQAKVTGVITSLDQSLPDTNSAAGKADWRTILARTLPYVDIFLPSIEEIIFMLRRADYDAWGGSVMAHISRAYLRALADELIAMGTGITGFKLGEMGVYLRTTENAERLDFLQGLPVDRAAWTNVEHWHPAFDVTVAGTTGAGDSCYGGFLTALLRGDKPQDAVRLACAVGACNVEAPDALNGVRTLAETEARLQAGWQTLNLKLPD